MNIRYHAPTKMFYAEEGDRSYKVPLAQLMALDKEQVKALYFIIKHAEKEELI